MAVLKIKDKYGVWHKAPSLKYKDSIWDNTGVLKYKDNEGVWHRVSVCGTAINSDFGSSDGGDSPTINFDPVFANNTWEDVITACQSGSVPDTWSVGDQMTMSIDGTDYLVDIIGKNHDDYADGSGKAPLTFQLHDVYNTTGDMMNGTATNQGGWKSCVMRNSLLPNRFEKLSVEIQSAIKEVTKFTSVGGASSTIESVADKLFLLSEVEVQGSTEKSYEGEGSQYEYYKSDANKIKYIGGNVKAWATRSPRKSNTGEFVFIGTSGVSATGSATAQRGVSFAFCF